MNVEAYRELLLKDAWFGALPPALIDLVLESSSIREYPHGCLIFATDDPPTGQFAVLEGEVRLMLHTLTGKQVIFPIFTPGSWFGHLSVLDDLPRFQDAVAWGATRLLFFSKPAFNRIIDQHPRYALDFARLLCRHIRTAMTLLANAQTEDLPTRLAQTLLDLSAARTMATQRISQESLAAMSGCSRQSVNKILKRWELNQMVKIGYGQVEVCDTNALRKLASGDVLDQEGKRRPSDALPFAG